MALPRGAKGLSAVCDCGIPDQDQTYFLFLGNEYSLLLLYMNHKTGDLETCFISLDSK